MREMEAEILANFPHPASDPHPMDDADDSDRESRWNWAWVAAETAPSIGERAESALWETA